MKESNMLQDANERWNDLQRVVRKLNAENSGDQGLNPWRVTGSSPASANICREEKFTASDIEFHLEPPLYTYNTLEKLSNLHPDRHFALLMGGDNINILHKWYRGEELLQKYPILVYPREGVDTEALCKEKGAIFIDAPMVNISSTQIRTMMAAGEDVAELRY